jgi:YjbE family integral membrane protein
MPLLEALIEIILVNLVLSGDNAVVIGLAARSLPPRQRRRAVVLGGGIAVLLRIVLTVPAELLLRVPYLRAGGGLLLLWIAYRLLTEEGDPLEEARAVSVTQAIRLIILADATMSLDNVLAVAAVAERSPHTLFVLVVGLLLSIPLVLIGGNLVARLMHRMPWLAWAGGAVLAYTAAELIAEDHGLNPVLKDIPHLMPAFGILLAVGLLAVAILRVRGRNRPEEAARAIAEARAGRTTRDRADHPLA